MRHRDPVLQTEPASTRNITEYLEELKVGAKNPEEHDALEEALQQSSFFLE